MKRTSNVSFSESQRARIYEVALDQYRMSCSCGTNHGMWVELVRAVRQIMWAVPGFFDVGMFNDYPSMGVTVDAFPELMLFKPEGVKDGFWWPADEVGLRVDALEAAREIIG